MHRDRKEAIELLSEARRYVKEYPRETMKILGEAMEIMRHLPEPKSERLRCNLMIAYHYIQVEPDVAIGYIAGASFELQCIKEDL